MGALLEPPPYTPPPMLSPNRRGSGLFSSIARFRRPPRTATSHLHVATATGVVSTFTGATTATTVHKAPVFTTPVAPHISSPGPPKSAPAFVKNLVDFSSGVSFHEREKCGLFVVEHATSNLSFSPSPFRP